MKEIKFTQTCTHGGEKYRKDPATTREVRGFRGEASDKASKWWEPLSKQEKETVTCWYNAFRDYYQEKEINALTGGGFDIKKLWWFCIIANQRKYQIPAKILDGAQKIADEWKSTCGHEIINWVGEDKSVHPEQSIKDAAKKLGEFKLAGNKSGWTATKNAIVKEIKEQKTLGGKQRLFECYTGILREDYAIADTRFHKKGDTRSWELAKKDVEKALQAVKKEADAISSPRF